MEPTVPVPMDRPAPTLTGKAGSQWVFTLPATTIAGDPRITARCHHEEGSQGRDAKTTEQVRAGDYIGTEPIRLTEPEAAILQSFPADYPWQGTRTKKFEQIGNAIPPRLAAHILAALLGIEVECRVTVLHLDELTMRRLRRASQPAELVHIEARDGLTACRLEIRSDVRVGPESAVTCDACQVLVERAADARSGL